MNFKKLWAPLAVIVLTAGAWRQFGWPGLAIATGGVLMWILLHFTRLMHILKKAADRPIGSVASAVMLNARLKKGVPLMHVIALTRSLGQLQSPPDTQPEVFVWTDNSQSRVTCTFVGGRLQAWQLERPAPAAQQAPGPAPRTASNPGSEPVPSPETRT